MAATQFLKIVESGKVVQATRASFFDAIYRVRSVPFITLQTEKHKRANTMLKKLQRIILAVATVGISSGLASTEAVAAPKAYVKVCNQTVSSNPVSGSFTFTIDEVVPTSPATPTRTVIVPVGGCSAALMVDAGMQIRVREQPGANIGVSAVTVTGGGNLVSTNPAKTTAIVLTPPLTTVVTFVNKKLVAVRADTSLQKQK